jgi:hypothetical protein
MDSRKRITQVVGTAAIVQLLALMLVQSIWSVIVPLVLASLPTALLAMRTPDMVEQMAPKLRQYYLFAAVLSCAVIGSFAFFGNDLNFDLQFLRAMVADVAILSLASTVVVQAARMRRT